MRAPQLAVAAVLVVVAACSGSASPATPPAPPSAPPAVAPPALAPPSAPPAPVAPPAPPECTAVGASVVVSTDRAHPVAYVGSNGVVVVDQSRQSAEDAELEDVPISCVVRSNVRAVPLPLAPPGPSTGGGCATALQILRVGGRLLQLECFQVEDDPDRPGSCAVRDPFATGNVTSDATPDELTTVGAAGVVGDSVIVGIVHNDEVRALAVSTHGALASAGTARIGTPGDSLLAALPDEILVRVDAVSPTEAVIYSGRKGGGIFQAIHVGPTAHRLVEPTRERLPAATPPAFAAQTVRPGHHAPSFVGLARGGVAPTAAIGGVDASVSTFSPTLVVRGTRGVLSWSEGTGHSTHIRAAIVDLAAGAIAGSIVEVSTPGKEAGYATLDSYGDHTVVTWDEKNGDVWEVRALDLRCTGLDD